MDCASKKPAVLPTQSSLSVPTTDEKHAHKRSISMDFHPSANSPSSPQRSKSSKSRPWGSNEELEHCTTKEQFNTLPSTLKHRSASTSHDQEGYLVVGTKKEQRKLSRKTKDIAHPLHYPKSTEALTELLEQYDPNTVHHDGLYPIHTYILRQRKKKYVDLLFTLLSQSLVNVDSVNLKGTPALHMAIQEGNLHVIKLLLVFGADVNILNSELLTALDIAVECDNEQAIALLQAVGAVQGELAKKSCFDAKIPRLQSFYDTAKNKAQLALRRRNVKRRLVNGNAHLNASVSRGEGGDSGGDSRDAVHGGGANGYSAHLSPAMANGAGPMHNGDAESMRERLFSNQSSDGMTLKDMEDGNTLSTLYEKLQQCINIALDMTGSFSANTDEAIAITVQQKELLKYKKTEQKRTPYSFNVQEGSRILFLDGGGIRGLVQIEILEQLEKKTGRKVTELFDWIVGTSTGGIVALLLVYAKKSLTEVRQIYFKMREKVFGSDRFGFAYNTENLEQLLKDAFGTTRTMADEEFPRVIITAVNKKTTMPELHFFNNCFQDEFSTKLVWKVARYTSAAPMFFTEFEDYVDGGVLANNPCSYGFSAIQNYHRQLGQKLDIALVVSVGSGIFPVEDLGKTDAQEFLYFGRHWLKAGLAIKARAKSLITLLTTALVESESVARSFSSRMQEQGIPFYRFNPQLDEVIPSGEIDLPKLVGMLTKTKIYVKNPQEEGQLMLDELVKLLHLVAEMSRKKAKN